MGTAEENTLAASKTLKKSKAVKKAKAVRKTTVTAKSRRTGTSRAAKTAKTERFHMRVEAETYARVRAKAAKLKRTVTSLVREAMEGIK